MLGTQSMKMCLMPRWLGAALILAALAGCAGLGGKPAAPVAPTTVVATVNGEPIRKADVDRQIEDLIRQARESERPPTERQLQRALPRLAHAAREQLIDKKVVEQAVREAKIQIRDTQVADRIRGMDQELKREGLSVEGLRDSMKVTPERFREMVRTQIEMETFWDGRLGLKPPAEAELRKVYEAHKKQFMMPQAAHLLEVFVPYPAGHRPTRAERGNLKLKAEALRARLLAGEPLANVARDGTGPGASDQVSRLEGDQGWVTGQTPLPTPVLKAAFNQPVGKAGEIIETADGYHIVVVSERREARQVPFDEVKDRLAAQMLRQARAARIPNEIEKLRKQAKIVES